jgi:hypothetical protein
VPRQQRSHSLHCCPATTSRLTTMPNITLPKRQVTFALPRVEDNDLTNLVVIFNHDDLLDKSQMELLSKTIKAMLQHFLLADEQFLIIDDFGDVTVTTYIENN